MESKFDCIIIKNNGIAATHFRKLVKNQLFCLEKWFKEAHTNLKITDGRLPNEDVI